MEDDAAGAFDGLTVEVLDLRVTVAMGPTTGHKGDSDRGAPFDEEATACLGVDEAAAMDFGLEADDLGLVGEGVGFVGDNFGFTGGPLPGPVGVAK